MQRVLLHMIKATYVFRVNTACSFTTARGRILDGFLWPPSQEKLLIQIFSKLRGNQDWPRDRKWAKAYAQLHALHRPP